jgi:hypothetical protein
LEIQREELALVTSTLIQIHLAIQLAGLVIQL